MMLCCEHCRWRHCMAAGRLHGAFFGWAIGLCPNTPHVLTPTAPNGLLLHHQRAGVLQSRKARPCGLPLQCGTSQGSSTSLLDGLLVTLASGITLHMGQDAIVGRHCRHQLGTSTADFAVGPQLAVCMMHRPCVAIAAEQHPYMG
jgi:hypothetical protein